MLVRPDNSLARPDFALSAFIFKTNVSLGEIHLKQFCVTLKLGQIYGVIAKH